MSFRGVQWSEPTTYLTSDSLLAVSGHEVRVGWATAVSASAPSVMTPEVLGVVAVVWSLIRGGLGKRVGDVSRWLLVSPVVESIVAVPVGGW